jgi:ankyrin repeat protein
VGVLSWIHGKQRDLELIQASTNGNLDRMRSLFGRRAKANTRLKKWRNAVACRGSGREALLAAGADPDASDQRGVTPSIGAAVNGHVEVVCAVLGAGAQISRPAIPDYCVVGFGNRKSGRDLGIARKRRGGEVHR